MPEDEPGLLAAGLDCAGELELISTPLGGMIDCAGPCEGALLFR